MRAESFSFHPHQSSCDTIKDDILLSVLGGAGFDFPHSGSFALP
jgi:hypothetical protein